MLGYSERVAGTISAPSADRERGAATRASTGEPPVLGYDP
jgi:hypothetical protein